jgi:PadR family transcriptional regulator, regulatory protein PadR
MFEAMRAEVLKGHVDLLLLAVLADQPAHGYRIVELVRERSDGVLDLAEGTVYPALYRLERQGVVTSSWSTVDGRRRRVYRLTRRGVKELAERRRAWTDFAGAVRAVLA